MPAKSAAKWIAPPVSSGSGSTGIGQRHVTATAIRECLDERLRSEPQCQHDLGHAAARQTIDESGDHRPMPDGEHRLGHAAGQRTQPRAESADEDDRAHHSVVVAGVVSPVVAGVVSPGTDEAGASSAGASWPVSTSPSDGRSGAHGGMLTSVLSGTKAMATTI
jgi:hypothetical protein